MKRALVIGTLVTAGLVLACDDDAMGLSQQDCR
jgi:hypothetical protein